MKTSPMHVPFPFCIVALLGIMGCNCPLTSEASQHNTGTESGVKSDPRCCKCRFFLYFLIHGLVNQTSITIFRATAAIGRAVVLCNVVAFIYIAYSLMLCGFIISYSETPFLTPARQIPAPNHQCKPICMSHPLQHLFLTVCLTWPDEVFAGRILPESEQCLETVLRVGVQKRENECRKSCGRVM